jgi:hypothetical protein
MVGLVKEWLCLVAIAVSAAFAERSWAQDEAEGGVDEAESPDETASEETEGDAEEEAEPKQEDAESPEDDDYGHSGQFGLRVGLVGGMRMVFRYDETALCVYPDEGEPQRFCGHAAPLAIETALSFAPLDSLEPFLWGRFGLSQEKQTNTDPMLIIGVGTRLYTMSDSRFKVFMEPAVGWELEGNAGPPRAGDPPDTSYKKDLVFHIAAGMQIDLAPAVGLFVDAGMTAGVLRALHANLELHGGVQVRSPEIW